MQSEKPKSVNETWCIHGKFIAGGSSNCRNETSGIEPTIVRPGALTETSRQRNHARTHASREPRGNQTMADSENRIRTSGNLRRQQFQNAETRTGDEGLILPVLTGGRQRENFWATRESKTWVRPHRARQKPDIGGKIRATNRDSGSKISVVKRNRSEGPITKSAEERSVRDNQKSEKMKIKTRALIWKTIRGSGRLRQKPNEPYQKIALHNWDLNKWFFYSNLTRLQLNHGGHRPLFLI
jgi:hypothetical protein